MTEILSNINAFFILKVGFLIVDSFYILFLLIVLNRVISMNKIVKEDHDEKLISLFAVFNILIAISLFLLALAIL